MNSLLVVLSKPMPGRDEAYNDWYSHVHVRDVMLSAGAVAVQRFAASTSQRPEKSDAPLFIHPYLAIYETDDVEKMTAGHAEVFTPAMPISDAFNFEDVREGYYHPLIERVNRPGARFDGSVVIERIHQRATGPSFEDGYADGRFRSVMRLPGVVKGGFYGLAEHQMMAPHADSAYIAIYGTSDPVATLAALVNLDVREPPAWSSADAISACYDPLMRRLPADDVRNPSPEARANADRARGALGGNVYKSLPNELEWK